MKDTNHEVAIPMFMVTGEKALSKPTMEQVGVLRMASRTTPIVTKITKEEAISEMEMKKTMVVIAKRVIKIITSLSR